MTAECRMTKFASAGVAVRQPVKAAVEDAGKPVPAASDEIPARRRPLLRMRLQDHRGQRRRKRQRTEAGNGGGNRDRDRELLKELSGDAAEKRGRHEHRAQHQRDRDQRAADFLHRLERRVAPAHAVLEMPLDVFDHHDRVVDHDADREHEAEQREIVDRESERRHHGEGADQRHRDGDDRNDRRPPALQEHQHDDDDQQHRLVDGLDQLADGLRDELGRVVADIVVEPLRETRPSSSPSHRRCSWPWPAHSIRAAASPAARPPISSAGNCWWCRTRRRVRSAPHRAAARCGRRRRP